MVRGRTRPVKEAVAKQLPFTYEAPSSVAQLVRHFEGRSAAERKTILQASIAPIASLPSSHACLAQSVRRWLCCYQRMISCNHLSLGGNNKAKLLRMAEVLLERFTQVGDSEPPSSVDMAELDALTLALFELAQARGGSAHDGGVLLRTVA
jgi:hypothetical protein